MALSRWRADAAFINVVASMAMVFSADVAIGLTYPILAVLLEARGVSESAIGINAAMSPLGIILAGFVLPVLVKRFGTKVFAHLGIAVIAACILALAYTSDFYVWCVIRLVLGVAVCMTYTMSEAWVMTFTPNERRGRVTAIYTMVMSAGFGLGPFLIPFTGIDGPLPFWIAFAAMLVASIPVLFVRLNNEHADAGENEESAGIVRFGLAAPLLLFAVLTMTLFDSTMLSFLPIYGLRSGLDLTTASWMLAIIIAGHCVLQYPVGWLADRWSRQGILWLCALLTIVLTALMPQIISTPLIWPAAFLLGASAYSIYTVALIVMGDNFRGAMLVAGSAALGAMWGVGGIVGAPVAGAVIDVAGIGVFPYLLTGVYVILLAGLVFTGGRLIRACTD
jgi:MFS family permease